MSSTEDTLIGGAQRPYRRAPGALEVLLVRHGAYARGDDLGADELFQGFADPPLNQLGRDQADLVAERLASEAFDTVFTSTLQRTSQTAAPLLARTAKEAVALDELREIYLGDFDGQEFERQRAVGNPLVSAILERERWDQVPGAERMEDFAVRVRQGLDRVAHETGGDAKALAFVHSGVIAELCAQITGSRRFAFIASENTSVTSLVRYPTGRWELRSFNDTAHLPR